MNIVKKIKFQDREVVSVSIGESRPVCGAVRGYASGRYIIELHPDEVKKIDAMFSFIEVEEQSICQQSPTTFMSVDAYGTVHMKNEAEKLHYDFGPAVEQPSGDKYWYRNGKLHREDGPAIEWLNGNKEWLKNGQRHREDGPAIEWHDGKKEWYIEGECHTEKEFNERTKNLVTRTVTDNGTVEYKNKAGQRHREDGPALESKYGDKYWYRNGKLHREDGPAMEECGGTKNWYIEDKKLTKKEFNERTKESEKQLTKLKQKPSNITVSINSTEIVIKEEELEVLKKALEKIQRPSFFKRLFSRRKY